MASGEDPISDAGEDAGAKTGSKVRVEGPLESASDEEVTLKTGSKGKSGLKVRFEEPLESSSDEEVTLKRKVTEHGETGGRSDTRKFPALASYGDLWRAWERKPGKPGRRLPPLVRDPPLWSSVYQELNWKADQEYWRYIQKQSEEDKETVRQQEQQQQESDPEEGPSGRQRLKNFCKSVLLDRPDSDRYSDSDSD